MKVLELGGNVAAAYTTKLLRDSGAEVLKLELPDGDLLRAQPPYFQALNAGKESATANFLADPKLLTSWLSWADIVVHDFGASLATELELTEECLLRRFPELVCCAITPFGQTGPYAQFAATELTLANAGGWANLCPATHTDPNLPPLKVHGDHCQMMAAISAAATTLAVARHSDKTGLGEYIDFSIQAYVASVLEAGVPAYAYKEEIANRTLPRSLIPWRIFQTKDAPVFIVCIEQDQWERLVKFMGDPDWASLPTFVDQPARQENQDLVHTLVQEFVSTWSAHELYHAAQKERICIAPVMDLEELAANEHLKARDFFVTSEHLTWMAPAILSTRGRSELYTSAPELGEHTRRTPALAATKHALGPAALEMTRPLSGIRVLDLTWAWAGPFCSMNLAHLGAEVIRIESSMRPDLYRRLPIYPVGVEDGLNRSGMFNQWNQGKSSVTVNLGTPDGIDLVKELVVQADVVVQNFATGVLERLGLGYDVLKAINQKVILASISGYGQSGPFKDYMGYGPAIPPLTGLSAATGFVNGEAEEIGLSMPDPTAGITAAYGVISALLKRDETGVGDHLDVSLWEATAVLNAQAWMNFQTTGEQPIRQGNRSESMAPHGVFRCLGEDHWISIACQSDNDWASLATLADLQDPRWQTLEARLAAQDEIEDQLSAWTQTQERWALTEQLQALGIAAFPSLTTGDIVNDPHLNARDFIERLEHSEVGARPHTGVPWRFRLRPNGVNKPAPCIDADTDHYLESLLGKTTAEITKLRATGIIGC